MTLRKFLDVDCVRESKYLPCHIFTTVTILTSTSLLCTSIKSNQGHLLFATFKFGSKLIIPWLLVVRGKLEISVTFPYGVDLNFNIIPDVIRNTYSLISIGDLYPMLNFESVTIPRQK